MRNLLPIALFITIVFVAINGAADWMTILAGFILALATTGFVRSELQRGFARLHLGRAVLLFFFFLKELWLSGVRVARDVLRPKFQFTPGIVAIPLSLERDAEIMLLANLITLTPGTMSLDVSDDKTTLYVHAMSLEDAESLRAEIKAGFEKKILEALR